MEQNFHWIEWIHGIQRIWSLKHELFSIWRSCLSHVSCWCCVSILVYFTRGGRFESFYCYDKYFCQFKGWTHRASSLKRQIGSLWISLECIIYMMTLPFVFIPLGKTSWWCGTHYFVSDFLVSLCAIRPVHDFQWAIHAQRKWSGTAIVYDILGKH